MRWVFWITGLFALAAAVALALRLNAGYALLVWPPYRAELSLNLLLLLLAAGFAIGYLFLRFIFGAIGLPAKVRAYREQRRREKAHAALFAAVTAFFEGRFGRAEKDAASVIGSTEMPALGAVLAARAAHELRHFDARDAYLARAEKLAPGASVARIIAGADMLLDQRRFQEALAVLRILPDKHTAALRLELKAQQQAKNWEQSLPLIEQLERRGVFDALQARQLRRYAHTENIRRQAHDRGALAACWQKIPAEQQRDAKVAGTAAQCYSALGGSAEALRIIEDALATDWESGLVGIYADCAGADVIRQIEHAEQWLVSHPRDAVLLFTLGRLCARQELWGKAQSYLEASLSVEPMYSAHLALAQLHDRLDHADAARRHYRESLDLAIGQLKQMTGGRRRIAL